MALSKKPLGEHGKVVKTEVYIEPSKGVKREQERNVVGSTVRQDASVGGFAYDDSRKNTRLGHDARHSSQHQ